jgi:multiple sugar transport system substrate-binding protein
MKRRSLLALGASAALLAACRNGSTGGSRSDRPLEIWWSEGYYPEEVDAIQLIANRWQKRVGVDVNLSLFSEADLISRASAAARGGPQPDILYGYGLGNMGVPRLAWEGLLADLSEQVEPLKAELLPGILQSVTYHNRRDRNRAIYAIPISQQSVNIHYWSDLLAQARIGTAIPSGWTAFWSFWKEAQAGLRRRGFADVYGMGLPMSTLANDTSDIFEYILEAHGAVLVGSTGQLRTNDPQVIRSVVSALADYTSHYRDGSVPPGSVAWSDADNNANFLGGLSLMTLNPTLSIPGSQVADELTYYQRLSSSPWPQTLSGEPMPSIPLVNQLVVFARSPRLSLAKEFVTELLQAANLSLFLKGSQGRFLPVIKPLLDQSFWKGDQDPHMSTARQVLDRRRQPYTVLNPAYSEVLRQKVWGKAIQAVAQNRLPVTQAADDAMKTIEAIFHDWWR